MFNKLMEKLNDEENIWQNLMEEQRSLANNKGDWNIFYKYLFLTFGLWITNNPDNPFTIDNILEDILIPKLLKDIKKIRSEVMILLGISGDAYIRSEYIFDALQKIYN